MSFEQIIFYALAGLTVIAALMLITSKNPVRAALFLVMAFVSCSGIWILLHAEFLGVALILVYVGAVMVLFLFVVMMLDINITVLREGFASYLPIGVLIALIVFAELAIILYGGQLTQSTYSDASNAIASGSNTKMLGQLLYTEYLYPVELAAVLLTVAIVAAIALTLRRRPGVEARYQDISKQVKVRASDRLRVVDVDSESNRHQTRKPEEDNGIK